MTAGNWLALSLFILIPSAVTFAVLFGVWRLTSWIILKFQEFVYRNDRRDISAPKSPQVSNRKQGSTGSSDDWENLIPIKISRTVSSGTYDPQTGEPINGKFHHTEHEMPLDEVKKLSEQLKQKSR